MYFTRKTDGFSPGAVVCANNLEEKPVSRRPANETHARSKMKVGRILAILVTGVAGGGAVAVTADPLVDAVRLRLLVRRLRMAIDAAKAGVVR